LQDDVKNSDEFWAKLRHDLNEARTAGEFPPGVIGRSSTRILATPSRCWLQFMEIATDIRIEGLRRAHRRRTAHHPNVAKLRRYGEQSEQIWITSSLQRISQYFANPDRIIQALQQRNIIQTPATC